MKNCNEVSDLIDDSSRIGYRPLLAGGIPDGRKPPAPGTNQIAGFVEYRPLAQ